MENSAENSECDKILDKILPSFSKYFSINKADVEPPFICRADFISHSEQYILVKAAKVADIDSNEYVYFACEPHLTDEKLAELDKAAWNQGLNRIKPYYGHRNSDITLIIICNDIDFAGKAEKSVVKSFKHYKSYRLGFYGWSSYKLAVICTEEKKVYTNRIGKGYKKLLTSALLKV